MDLGVNLGLGSGSCPLIFSNATGTSVCGLAGAFDSPPSARTEGRRTDAPAPGGRSLLHSFVRSATFAHLPCGRCCDQLKAAVVLVLRSQRGETEDDRVGGDGRWEAKIRQKLAESLRKESHGDEKNRVHVGAAGVTATSGLRKARAVCVSPAAGVADHDTGQNPVLEARACLVLMAFSNRMHQNGWLFAQVCAPDRRTERKLLWKVLVLPSSGWFSGAGRAPAVTARQEAACA